MIDKVLKQIEAKRVKALLKLADDTVRVQEFSKYAEMLTMRLEEDKIENIESFLDPWDPYIEVILKDGRQFSISKDTHPRIDAHNFHHRHKDQHTNFKTASLADMLTYTTEFINEPQEENSET